MEGILKEMSSFYDEMAAFQADAMVVNLLFLFNCSKSSPRKRRCDLKKLKAKTVEITKKDVALNNLIQRAKPIMHV